MSAAEHMVDDFRNRRQLFRIADPEFASMRVLLKTQSDFVECACLDISATGIGVLVPAHQFGSAQAGVILDYQLHFGHLSPVSGIAVVANRTETSVADSEGPLLRLGLRFSDAEPMRLGRRNARERRSQRHFLPDGLRPLCICNDPLWLGEELSIAVHDFSLHGMSGVVSAKRTVFAEGLRTVFRFGFPYIGIVEVPVRVIYANPTDDELIFRIGCEFVHRSAAFTSAIETFFKMQLFDRSRSGALLRGLTEPRAFVLSDASLIAEAEESFEGPTTETAGKVQERHTLYGSLASSTDSTAGPYFRFELQRIQETGTASDTQPSQNVTETSTANAASSAQLRFGSQVLVLALDDLSETLLPELSPIVSSLLCLAVVRRIDAIRFVVSDTRPSTDASALFERLRQAGIKIKSPRNRPLERELTLADALAGRGLTSSLWWQSFLPLARFERLMWQPLQQIHLPRRLILKGVALFCGDKPQYLALPEQNTILPKD